MIIPIAIVIINYKMEDLTISFIKNELSKIEYPHRIVIVNNEATKESDIFLRNELDADLVYDIDSDYTTNCEVVIISSQKNLGFARGNNLGVLFCKKWFAPEYYLFTNNDIQIKDTNVVEQLIDKLSVVSNIGIIGPRIVGLDGIEQSPYPYYSFVERYIWAYWSSFFYTLPNKIKRFNLDYPQKAIEGYHYYVMGSFFVVRASDFYCCGMFDPATFLYAEEMILSERMNAIKKKVYYYPSVTVIHAHGATTKRYAKNSISSMQFDSVCYYYKKYRHTNSFFILIGKITQGLLNLKEKIELVLNR